MLVWGISDYLGGRFSQKFSPEVAYFLINISGGVLSLAASAINGVDLSRSWSEVGIIVIVAMLFVVAYLSMMRAIVIGPVGVAVPVANSYLAFTILLGLIFGASITGLVVLGGLLVVAGGSILSIEKTEDKVQLFKSKAFKISMISVFAWGTAFYLIDYVDNLSWTDINLVLALVTMPASLVILFFKKENIPKAFSYLTSLKTWYYWLPGILAAGGVLTLTLANEKGNDVVIPAAVAAASPVVTVLLARIIDKDNLEKWKYVGVLLAVAGVILLNIG